MSADLPAAEMHRDAEQAFQWSVTHALERLGTRTDIGLPEEEAQRRLAAVGFNELREPPAPPVWRRLFRQFNELVVWILIAAAIVSVAIGEWADAVAIGAIVVANAAIGFFQENKAERALAALKRLAAPTTKVLRAGRLREIPARLLTVGDVVELEAGDNVPADARVVLEFGLRTQEAALTGESASVNKQADAVHAPDTPLAERHNMVYMGTVVVAGKATAVVTAVGMQSELGRIANLLESEEREPTPLQRHLAGLGRLLIGASLAIVTIIFVLQLWRGGALIDVAFLAISLGVAAVPEGLPAVVTLALAIGVERMAKRNALVRQLPSVETLGCVTVICSDKTGTLTCNEMTARVVIAGDGIYRVSGSGYAAEGSIARVADIREAVEGSQLARDASAAPVAGVAVGELSPDLERAIAVGMYCTNARLEDGSDAPKSWKIIGDPTEGALLVLARKAGCAVDAAQRCISEIPFDSQRKAMSVVFESSQGERTLYCKGAPEVVLNKCDCEMRDGQVVPLSEARRDDILRVCELLAARALRVLGLASLPHPVATEGAFEESHLVFAGLVGMTDPPRKEVYAAVERCRKAGIRPVMITGDHPLTARAIAEELEILGADDRLITGREIEGFTPEELIENVAQISVYSRVLAEHKLRVVRAWQARGEAVAMTGDGVNDAPAIKAADVGIAMGITGTDVTKEAADIVLVNDNFATIVDAVEEGRGIYDNVQKFVHYLLACNAGEVLFMLFAAVLGWPIPLVALQILWINLVTDGLPALALGLEPPEPDIMLRAPRPPRERLITRSVGLQIAGQGLLVAGVTMAAFWWIYRSDEEHLAAARTAAFFVMALSQLFFSFACRSQRYTLPQLGIASNPYLFGAIAISGLLQFSVMAFPALARVFEVTGLPIEQWALVFLLSLTPVTFVESAKLIRHWWHPAAA